MNKTFKKIAYQLHLWIGCLSGLIVFVVCITGAIWALGINGWVGSSKTIDVPTQNQLVLSPSQLAELTKDSLQGSLPSFVRYSKDQAVLVRAYGDEVNMAISVNPYSGEILELEDYSKAGEYEFTFWDYMRWGHRALWLPWDVGRVIVNYGTLAFVIVLISGLILWIPRTMKGAKNRLWFNWRKGTNLKRKMYDMHLVLGFYSCFLLLVICCTGMVWGLEWWSLGVYRVTTGKELPEWKVAESDTTHVADSTHFDLTSSIDYIFSKLITENKDAQSITINYPDTSVASSTIGAKVSHDDKVLYNYDSYAFDRYTLKEIELDGYQYGKYAEKGAGEKLRRQNYDLHIGAAWGNVGRVLMFFAALFGASLPLSGYYILFKVKKRKKKKVIA